MGKRNKEVRDFYYSDKEFNEITLAEIDENKLVCECNIDGKWFPFTEDIDLGRKPLSVWKDLKYVGKSKETRYTKASKWIKERRQSQIL